MKSSRESYGDDAVGYVQLKRDSSTHECTIMCGVCPEHKVRTKPYTVTVVVDEKNGVVVSARCQDCAASAGGCKHAVAVLMWLHRRSEEPSCTQVECYWKKSLLSKVGTSLKSITAKEIAKGNISNSSDNTVFNKFMELAAVKEIKNCELIRYMKDPMKELVGISMYQLSLKYAVPSSDEFIDKILPLFTSDVLKEVEEKTRDQSENTLWHELRFARVTASKAYEISRCKTGDGASVSMILGSKVPETPAMKRGRVLEQKVLQVVGKLLGKHIKKCGLFISKLHPMIAVSPDGRGEHFLVEIKCPFTEDTIKNYVQDGKPSKKCYAQLQLQMYNTHTLLKALLLFWKSKIYPLLFKMSKT
ncbi:hypothetical protein ACJJTC_003162 [Scirpophaga incertulas]